MRGHHPQSSFAAAEAPVHVLQVLFQKPYRRRQLGAQLFE
jgi:hypothetical protein